MKEKNEDSQLNEQLRMIKYKSGYKINETPKYRPLISGEEQFDEIPQHGEVNMTGDGMPQPTGPNLRGMSEAGDQEDAEKQGLTPTEPSNAETPNDSTPALPDPEAGIDVPQQPLPPEGGMPTTDPMGGIPPVAQPSPEQEVNVIQNEIIKHNIEAMKSIQAELDGLNSTVQGLNAALAKMNADVEEVREPTNVEKLMSKKNVSYPYYFNLNDFWSDNWFDQQRQQQGEKGIRELPDGTYIADFDDLPQKSKIDVQDSFNDLI